MQFATESTKPGLAAKPDTTILTIRQALSPQPQPPQPGPLNQTLLSNRRRAALRSGYELSKSMV